MVRAYPTATAKINPDKKNMTLDAAYALYSDDGKIVSDYGTYTVDLTR
jgi:hypothetical protein